MSTRITVYGYTEALAYNGDGLVEYQGWAVPGSLKSQAKWRIIKLTYNGTNVTDIQFAKGLDTFDNIWDDRASLSYS